MGLIANEIITQVLDRSDIVTIIGNYTPLKKAGRNFKALCPFHQEKSSSFVVNPDKQIFHCFGCGVGGNVIGFVMRQERMEFPEAVRLLADKAGIVIPEDTGTDQGPAKKLRDDIYNANKLAVEFFHGNLLNSREPAVEVARNYLKNRGVSLEVVKQFQIGCALDEWDALLKFLRAKGVNESLAMQAGLAIAREGKSGAYDRFRNRVIFPIFDIQSRPVAFGARALSDTEGAKYINSPETPVYTKGQHLFGFNLTKAAAGELDSLIVVEGYMDMIMPFCNGVKNIAASLGTALTDQQIRLIRRYTPKVVMLFDTDPAGQSAINRSLDLLIDEGMKVTVVTLKDGEDPDSFIRQEGIERFNERLAQAASLFDYKFNYLCKQYDANSVDGKSQICQGMLTTINRYKDEVVKYELNKQLAVRLNLPEAVVLKTAQQLPKAPTVTAVSSKAIEPIKPMVATVRQEELLLTLFLKDPAWVVEARQFISPEDFSDGKMRDIVKEIWAIAQENQEWSLNDLLIRLQEPHIQGFLTQLSSQDEAKLGLANQVFQDCIGRIQQGRLRQEKQKILEAMRRAQAANDEAALHQLREQFNTLIRT